MHVSWPTLADFLEPAERVRAVRAAWHHDAMPYDSAPAQRILQVEHALQRWCATQASVHREPLAGAVIRWLVERSSRNVSVSAVSADLFGLQVLLRPVVRAIVGGQAVSIYLHLAQQPPTDRHIRGAIALMEHHDVTVCGQSRRGLFLDVPTGRLHQPDDHFDLGTLEQPTHRLHAMVRRFSALAEKANIFSYLPPTADIPGWDLAQLDWTGVSRVLDAGCGTGRHLSRLRSVTAAEVVGFDPSIGAAAQARTNTRQERFGLLSADLKYLPFATSTFDVVMAMQMLYNVEDLDRGLSEIRRVLRVDGQLLAATNSVRNLDELNRMIGEAVRRLIGTEWTGANLDPVQARFTMENGEEVLRRHFRNVDSHRLEERLFITNIDAITGYLRSTRTWREQRIPDGLSWDEIIAMTGQIAAETIAARGGVAVTVRQGVFVGSALFGFRDS